MIYAGDLLRRSVLISRRRTRFTLQLGHPLFINKLDVFVLTRGKRLRRIAQGLCLNSGGCSRLVVKGRSLCERCLVNQRKYGKQHKQEAAQRQQKYRQLHSETNSRYSDLPIESFSKYEIFVRDNWHCALCACLTPEALLGTFHAQAPTLGHIIPISRQDVDNPGHVRSNVRCECWSCNSRKGSRLDSEIVLDRVSVLGYSVTL